MGIDESVREVNYWNRILFPELLDLFRMGCNL
jgi:hypothetical protein